MQAEEITGAVSRSKAQPRYGLVQVRERKERATPAARTRSAESLMQPMTGTFRRRKIVNALMLNVALVCAIVAVVPLLAIAVYVAFQGVTSLNLAFFTHAQSEVDLFGNAQGIGNTIVGTLLIVLVSCAIGLPIGLFSGIYLAEYGRGRFANVVRFLADVMAGLPSIVAGLVGFAVVVVFFGVGFSALAAGFALGLLMFPVVTRSTEEVLRLVPHSVREGGLALGIPRWRVIVSIVLPAAANGIITSMLLGIARVTGETAPLLFTSFDNTHWEWNPLHAVGALTVTIYNYTSNQPDPRLNQMAYAGALVLVAVVVALNLVARLLVSRRVRGRT